MTMRTKKMIAADVPECSQEDLDLVEEIMRHEVFCSTLDWQTRAQFRRGARKAFALLPGYKVLQEQIRSSWHEPKSPECERCRDLEEPPPRERG